MDFILDAPSRPGRTYDLSSILDHPRLFAAYPELKKVRVWPASDSNFAGRFNNGLAAEDDGTPVHVIELNFDQLKNDDEALSVLLHEIQHGIQDTENFATGASPDYMESEIKALSELEGMKSSEMDSSQRALRKELQKIS